MPSRPYKISSKSNKRFTSCAHLISLNARYIEMVEATGLNMEEGRLQCHHLHTKFHPNPLNGSKIKVFLYTHLRSLNIRHF
jgi:hypothetical protein